MSKALASRRILVRGSVQGVGFRWWVSRNAILLGISGEVCNLCDGSVEILASGSGEALAELEEMCRKGPSGALVESLETMEIDIVPPPGFRVSRGTSLRELTQKGGRL